MKNIILQMYGAIINLTMALIIIGTTIVSGVSYGIMAAIFGFCGALLFVSFFFGFLLLIIDIRESLVAIRKQLEKKT